MNPLVELRITLTIQDTTISHCYFAGAGFTCYCVNTCCKFHIAISATKLFPLSTANTICNDKHSVEPCHMFIYIIVTRLDYGRVVPLGPENTNRFAQSIYYKGAVTRRNQVHNFCNLNAKHFKCSRPFRQTLPNMSQKSVKRSFKVNFM